jgi:hypothetical protein
MANPVQSSSSKIPAMSPAKIPISRTDAFSSDVSMRGRNTGELSYKDDDLP